MHKCQHEGCCTPKTLVVGLTGGVATGKTTTSALFRAWGAQIVSCDVLAHRALRQGTASYRAIVRHFGRSVLRRSGAINRKVLAKRVFAHTPDRRVLEKIIHPFVFDRVEEAINRARGILILEVPLLFETGFDRVVDRIIVASCPTAVQRTRIMARGIDRVTVDNMLRAQWPLAKKCARADWVVHTSTMPVARREARAVWKKVKAKYKGKI